MLHQQDDEGNSGAGIYNLGDITVDGTSVFEELVVDMEAVRIGRSTQMSGKLAFGYHVYHLRVVDRLVSHDSNCAA